MTWRHILWLFFLLPGCSGLDGNNAAKPLNVVGEKAPSEDPVIWDFHALGPINGADHLFRSASPLRDLVKTGTVKPEDAQARQAAAVRMKSLYERGIRAIVSLENADSSEKEDKGAWMALEQAAAKEAGLTIVNCPMANSGANSIEDQSDLAVKAMLDKASLAIFQHAKDGGVLIHCSAGHDRTALVVAYLRIKYQQWTVDNAIAEMRFYGHNWVKFSKNGGVSSWHEDHLRGIAEMLKAG